MRRRDLLAGAAVSVAGAGCSRRPIQKSSATEISILRSSTYSQEVYGVVRRMLDAHKLNVKGKRVVLKPNLVEFDPETSINTHPIVVHAALEAFRELGAAEVKIAEGPGHRRDTFALAEAAGYFEIIPGFEGLFTDLNLDETSPVRLRNPESRLESLYLPNTILRADLLVSLPKMKTHHWVGATLGMKNLFGVVPGAVYGWPKNVLHWAGIGECIADLHRLFPRTFTIVDGIVGMEGNGPIQGTPKNSGVMVAGSDPVAVDATCCRIMGMDPEKINYITLAGEGDLDAGRVMYSFESVRSVQTRFELIPQFSRLRLEHSQEPI